MDKQMSLSALSDELAQVRTKKKEFLTQMDRIIPWGEWIALIRPCYYKGERGNKPYDLERMLRIYMIQNLYNLSDMATVAEVIDSRAFSDFCGVESSNQVPDGDTLGQFRNLLIKNGLQEKLFAQVVELLTKRGLILKKGTIVDSTFIEAPSSTKNKDKKRDPEMHSTKKNTKWYFGMRVHVGADPYYGFVHDIISTPANEAECKIAPKLLRKDDVVVYGDAGYLKMENYVTDGVEREYKINRQRGTFKRHYGDSLSWQYEKEIEKRKSSVRCKVEYVFHIVKDIFRWRKLRYKGLHKNNCHANLLFACANIYMLAMG